jgi:hypothetical protein
MAEGQGRKGGDATGGKTMTIHRDQVWEITKMLCAQRQIDPWLQMAFNEQESDKDDHNPLLYDPSIPRMENAFRERYIDHKKNYATTTAIMLASSFGIRQMLGESLLELGWFISDFARQNDSYRATYGNDPMHYQNVIDAINRYCVEPSEQIATGIDWYLKKLKAAGGDQDKAILYYNGGGRPEYKSELLARIPKLQSIYKQ